jgi:hypothetical protein
MGFVPSISVSTVSNIHVYCLSCRGWVVGHSEAAFLQRHSPTPSQERTSVYQDNFEDTCAVAPFEDSLCVGKNTKGAKLSSRRIIELSRTRR